jgi:pyruvate/2-oxoglutarate dehydrogenase complex dihydrolipoamide acyltransferase (E2) component
VIETDKVNVDIRSATSGTIKKYFAAEGDTVKVDADFYEIEEGGAKKAEPKKEEAAPKKVSKIFITIKLRKS